MRIGRRERVIKNHSDARQKTREKMKLSQHPTIAYRHCIGVSGLITDCENVIVKTSVAPESEISVLAVSLLASHSGFTSAVIRSNSDISPSIPLLNRASESKSMGFLSPASKRLGRCQVRKWIELGNRYCDKESCTELH